MAHVGAPLPRRGPSPHPACWKSPGISSQDLRLLGRAVHQAGSAPGEPGRGQAQEQCVYAHVCTGMWAYKGLCACKCAHVCACVCKARGGTLVHICISACKFLYMCWHICQGVCLRT